MNLKREDRGDAVLFCLSGKRSTADGMRELYNEMKRLQEEGIKRLVIDMSGVDMLTSMDLGTLVKLFKSFKAYGGLMVLAGMSDRITRLFEVTKLDHVIPSVDSVDRALEVICGGEVQSLLKVADNR